LAKARDPGELRVMPWWSVLVGLLLAVLFGWLVLGWLLGEADHAGQADTTVRRTPLVDQARASAAGAHVWPAKVTVNRLDDDWLVLTDG
jgi:hypothetical protein